ncbi:MAG: (E)-4-hydroxy-3-methylbut-2-enyl-diphosphate synthase [Fibrobacteria bacterium]|nr:(E)-4-hydroxy-3-methylbut-2-enyl-diphosphate synthase [Fibrobacteria bacterium]
MKQLSYIKNRYFPKRRKTVCVKVGNKFIGGDAPILIQSMVNTSTADIQATVNQVLELAQAGCELARITVPSLKDARRLEDIMGCIREKACMIPVSADIHFKPEAAFEALKWVDKVRINPGNFAERKSPLGTTFSDGDFEIGAARVREVFTSFVQEAMVRQKSIRIGINHGSLSERMIYRYGDTVEGMVESALEYLAICEELDYDQVVISMKSSNPRVAVQAYRLLVARLERGFKPYPFHLGVTEAGDGADGRLKSAVGIGALLLDGIGDTIRVSLTEHPVKEIPVARLLVDKCSLVPEKSAEDAVNHKNEHIDYYHYRRRECRTETIGNLLVGGRETIAVGLDDPGPLFSAEGERKLEWYSSNKPQKSLPSVVSGYIIQGEGVTHYHDYSIVKSSYFPPQHWPEGLVGTVEIVLEDISFLSKVDISVLPAKGLLWSVAPQKNIISALRSLTAWLHHHSRKDPIVLRGVATNTPGSDLYLAASMGAVLADGIGDMLQISGTLAASEALELGYGILQAAGARRTKTEYISCPGCGRTLFNLEATLARVRDVTSHLGNVSLAVMGCIVNGPGEMADADFGYVGGSAGKINLYVGKECVRKNIPESDAPQALVALIKEHGKWRDQA